MFRKQKWTSMTINNTPLAVTICSHIYGFVHSIVKQAFVLQTAHILRPRSCGHRCDARQRIQPGWAEGAWSQMPGKTFKEAIHTRMQLFWILSACTHACVSECVSGLGWISLKQPDSLIYPGRLRSASANKRVWDEATHLSVKCPWN